MSRFCWLRIFNPARIQIFSSYSKYSPKISQIFPVPSSLHPQKRTTQRQRQRGNVEPWGVDFTLRGGYGWSIQFLCGCIIQHRDEERGTKKIWHMISWKMEMVGGKWLATLIWRPQACFIAGKWAFYVSIDLDKFWPKLFFWSAFGMTLDPSWLVVNPPLWKMMEFVSWDDDIPNMMGKS